MSRVDAAMDLEHPALQPAGEEPPQLGPDLAEFAIYFDGGGLANPGKIAVAAVVVDRAGEIVIEKAELAGEGTNNEAEYKALLHAIRMANFVGAQRPHFVSDSMLVVQQISNWWAIKDAKLAPLHHFASSFLMNFDEWSIQHVSRERNKRADWLVNRLLRGDDHARTLKTPPTAGIEFRTGTVRPGWVGIK